MLKISMRWILFFSMAIIAQRLLPGLDFLAAGILVCLEEQNPVQTTIVTLLTLLIQEGTGNMDFGACVLRYTAFAAVFLSGRRLFGSHALLFWLFLCAVLGPIHYGMTCLSANLQNIDVLPLTLDKECFFQTILMPIIWKIMMLLKPETPEHAYSD
ncbi:MAG: hypothetical protein PUB69_02655 [Desulfovibrionaceae bacterium]|nr:hypothetical protein [Desulfovibrionaceae bacterium]